MSDNDGRAPLARRVFLSRLGLGSAAFGTAVGSAGASRARAQSAAGGLWHPSRHAQDDWLDRIQGQHRLALDATTPDGLEKAMSYAHNYLAANESAYGLKDSDVAMVIITRHLATVFAYNDAMWAKYGAALSQIINFSDRKTTEPPITNPYKSGRESSLDSLSKRGVQLAVCEMATRVFAGGLARRTVGDADTIHKELRSNLVANSHVVPAGIVTVNRAQERGYAVAYAG